MGHVCRCSDHWPYPLPHLVTPNLEPGNGSCGTGNGSKNLVAAWVASLIAESHDLSLEWIVSECEIYAADAGGLRLIGHVLAAPW